MLRTTTLLATLLGVLALCGNSVAQPAKVALSTAYFTGVNCTGSVDFVYIKPGPPTVSTCSRIVTPLNTCTPESSSNFNSSIITCTEGSSLMPSFPLSGSGILSGLYAVGEIFADANCSESMALRTVAVAQGKCVVIPDGIGLPFKSLQGQCQTNPIGEGYLLGFNDTACTKPSAAWPTLPLDNECVPAISGAGLSDRGFCVQFGSGGNGTATTTATMSVSASATAVATTTGAATVTTTSKPASASKTQGGLLAVFAGSVLSALFM